MVTGEDLYQFLTSHGCFNGFCTAIDDQHGVSFAEIIKGQRSFANIINASINWDNTREGSNFWYNINNLWVTAHKSGIFIKSKVNCNSIWRIK